MSQMDPEKFLIPRRLEDGAQFFIWDADSAVLFISCILMCSLLLQLWGFLVGALVGYYATKLLSNLKEMGGKQVVMGVLYWYTPSRWWPAFKHLRCESHIREYVG